MGVPLAAAVQAIGQVRPSRSRMSPITRPDGVTFIADTWKASLWSIPAALQFVQQAQAPRKTVVIGTISDYSCEHERAYISIAREALEVADHVVFVGPRASKCLKAKRHPDDRALQAFYSKHAACDYLREWLRPGDLVLIKASASDQLRTIVEESLRPSTPIIPSAAATQLSADAPCVETVVGFGNPGAKYDWTPHNIGHRVLDTLAGSFGQDWVSYKHAMVARFDRHGQRICLIKVQAKVNASGPVLAQLGEQLGFGPAQCILVHDDLDLPLGKVRVRTGGGDGGHRGVRSVLESFRTDAIRRVEIGVGRPGQKDQLPTYVVTAFSSLEKPVVERACADAANQLRQLLGVIKASASDQLRTIVEKSLRPSTPIITGAAATQQSTGAPRVEIVVGLGNPGAKYDWTPHNIGHRVLDTLAGSFGQDWVSYKHAMVARFDRDGQSICLIKLQVKMTASGPALGRLGHQHGFGSADCVLVHDDTDLPLGKVHVRTEGGDGGHRGVRSVLESFGTDAVRRVRVGVGKPGQKDQLATYVLTPFSSPEKPVIERACADAAIQLRQLLSGRSVV